MSSLELMFRDGVARNGVVNSAFVGVDGTIHRINFDRGWNGVDEFKDAEPGDEEVRLASPCQVRIIRLGSGQEKIAPEDLPRVRAKVLEAFYLQPSP